MNKIRMLRKVVSRVELERRLFNKGQVYGDEFAPWLPLDSYEEYVPKPVEPNPNEEVFVDYEPKTKPVPNEIEELEDEE
jgi:hypothetical protein